MLNDKIIGFVKEMNADNFHNYGQFIEEKDFSLIMEKIRILEALWLKSEDELLTDVEEQHLEKLTEEIDDLNLMAGIGNNLTKIRDFKVIQGICEFKFVF